MDDLFKKLIDVNGKVVAAITAFTGLLSGMALFFKLYKQNPVAFFTSLVVFLAFLIFLIVKIIYSRSKRTSTPVVDDTGTKTLFIRGLLPFEKGQVLLGRDHEAASLLTIVQSAQFRFGYISGEAGTGKTSFLRAKFSKAVEDTGQYQIIYLPNTQKIEEDIRWQLPYSTKNASLTELIAFNIKESRKHLLLIIDQFEEFFIKVTTVTARKEFARTIAALLHVPECHVLLSIRKEFVEDLRDFKPFIPDPKSDKYSVYIQNWDADTIKELFELFVEKDRLNFSPQLKEQLIKDLSRNGGVRPVELQLVAKYLADKKFNTLPDYKAVGGSGGILKNIILEVMGNCDSELEKICIKIVLRSLCDEVFDTKRSDGAIAVEKLMEEVQQFVKKAGGQHHSASGKEAMEKSMLAAIAACTNNGFIQPCADGRLVLTHDYIVASIKQATSDLKTQEEKAHSLLKYYLDRKTIHHSINLSRKDYRFIIHNASADVLSQPATKALLNESKQKRRLKRNVMAGAAGLLIVLTGWLSYRSGFYVSAAINRLPVKDFRTYDSGYVSYRSRDGVFFAREQDSLQHPIPLPASFIDHTFNPGTNLLAAISSSCFYICTFKDHRLVVLDSAALTEDGEKINQVYRLYANNGAFTDSLYLLLGNKIKIMRLSGKGSHCVISTFPSCAFDEAKTIFTSSRGDKLEPESYTAGEIKLDLVNDSIGVVWGAKFRGPVYFCNIKTNSLLSPGIAGELMKYYNEKFQNMDHSPALETDRQVAFYRYDLTNINDTALYKPFLVFTKAYAYNSSLLFTPAISNIPNTPFYEIRLDNLLGGQRLGELPGRHIFSIVHPSGKTLATLYSDSYSSSFQVYDTMAFYIFKEKLLRIEMDADRLTVKDSVITFQSASISKKLNNQILVLINNEALNFSIVDGTNFKTINPNFYTPQGHLDVAAKWLEDHSGLFMIVNDNILMYGGIHEKAEELCRGTIEGVYQSKPDGTIYFLKDGELHTIQKRINMFGFHLWNIPHPVLE
jgi:hypothetical protein